MAKRENILERLKQGASEQGFEIVERLSKTGIGGASRSQVFKAVERKTGDVLALKASSYGFLDSFEDPDTEKLEDFWNREREVLQLAGSHPNIPDYRGNFIIPENENHHKINVLLMQYLDLKSIEDRIRSGEKISEREAQILLRDGLSAEKHLHTGLPYQVLHRDVKPANALLNGEKAYVIDFDIVKQGDNDATSQTGVLNLGYYPADAFNGHPKPEHDVVALGNVAIAGISGKPISLVRGNDVYGLDPVDTSNLLVSPDLRKYLAKLTANNGQRFKTAQEAIVGLERIVGMPVPVKTLEKVTPLESGTENVIGNFDLNSVLPEVVERGINHETGERSIRINDIEYNLKDSIYETAKNIIGIHSNKTDANLKYRTNATNTHAWMVLPEERKQHFLAYLQHAAQEYPILQEVIDRKRTLEDVVGEKKPLGILAPTARLTPVAKFIEDKTSEFKQRRKDLYEIFGEKPNSVAPVNTIIGGILGAVGSYFAVVNSPVSPSFLQFLGGVGLIAGSPLAGLAGGIKIDNYLQKRKLLREAREMDSWIREARVSQGSLEDRTKEVELTRWEKGRELFYASFAGGICGLICGGIGGTVYAALNGIPSEFPEIPAIVAGTAGFIGIDYYLYGEFKSLALGSKRLTNRLSTKEEKPNTVEYCFKIHTSESGFHHDLLVTGFDKKWFRNEYSGEGVKISYEKSEEKVYGGLSPDCYLIKKIKITGPQEKADAAVAELREVGLIRNYNEISQGGSEE